MPKRTDILSILALGAAFVGSAHASIPTGQKFGAWHVSSISSLSGVDGDDASAGMAQDGNCRPDGGNCDQLQIRWTQGFDIRVSIDIDDCAGADEDFEQGYSIPVARWKKAGRAIEQRIENDFKAWLAQAALMCKKPERATIFDLKQLRLAVRDFTQRLNWFSQ